MVQDPDGHSAFHIDARSPEGVTDLDLSTFLVARPLLAYARWSDLDAVASNNRTLLGRGLSVESSQVILSSTSLPREVTGMGFSRVLLLIEPADTGPEAVHQQSTPQERIGYYLASGEPREG